MSAPGAIQTRHFSGRGALEMLAALLIVLAMQWSLALYAPPPGSIVLRGAVAVDREGSPLGTGTAPLLYSSGFDEDYAPGIYRFSMEFPAGADYLGKEDLLLVLPHISGSALQAKLNGLPLGTRGDFAGGRSTVWNSVHVFPLPGGLLREANLLELSVNGAYEAGIVMPPFIVSGKAASLRVFFLLFLSNYLIWICVGALLVVAFIIFWTGVVGGAERDTSILLGVAGLCAALVLLDFACIERLPMSLVVFKRLVVGARHLSAAILVWVFAKILGRRPGPVAVSFIVLQLACLAVIALWPGGVAQIKRLYGWTYLAFVPILAYLLFLALFTKREGGAYRLLVFGVTLGFLAFLRDVVYVALVRDAGAIMISHYGFAVLSLCGADFVVGDTSARYRELAAERRRAARFREEALKDPLTEAYNRKILPVLAEDLRRPYSILGADLDDLKVVNDEYGHATGDSILVDLVRTMRRNVREDDVIVRMGGDEFVVVLRSCQPKIAREIAERVLADCAKAAVPVVEAAGELEPEALGNLSYSISIGLASRGGEGASSLDELLGSMAEADKRLYEAKQGGKGLIAAD